MPSTKPKASSSPNNVDTRQRLVNTAIRLFQRQGYYATGLNALLVEADCPKGSLYHHFPGGKTDLAIACLQQLTKQVEVFINSFTIKTSTGPGLSTLQATNIESLIQSIFKQTQAWLKQESWQAGSLFSIINHETTAQDTAIRKTLSESYRCIAKRLCLFLKQGGLSSEHAQAFSQQFIIAYEGSLSLAAAMANKQPLQQAQALLLKQLSVLPVHLPSPNRAGENIRTNKRT